MYFPHISTRYLVAIFSFIYLFSFNAQAQCQGVTISTVNLTTGCGSVDWEVQFTLNSPATQAGFICQKITLSYDVHTCDDVPHQYGAAEFWEVWPVDSGATSPTANDHYVWTTLPVSYGYYDVRGEVGFFPGLTLDSTWQTNNNPHNTTGPSTGTQPAFWNSAVYGCVVRHHMDFNWDCCPGHATYVSFDSIVNSLAEEVEPQWIYDKYGPPYGEQNGGEGENKAINSKSPSSLQGFIIVPNPISERDGFQIVSEDQVVSLSIINMMGQIIYQKENFDVTNDVYLPDLSPGYYSVIITNPDGVLKTSKLLVHDG